MDNKIKEIEKRKWINYIKIIIHEFARNEDLGKDELIDELYYILNLEEYNTNDTKSNHIPNIY